MSHATFTSKDWENYAQAYDGLNALSPYRELQERVLNALEQQPPARVLEAACGTGNFTKLLINRRATQRQSFNEIVAVDYSVEMMARARVKCGGNARFVRTDLNAPLPFPEAYFDTVVSVNTLYALNDPCAVLTEFARVITCAGRLILVTPKHGYENGLILKAHCQSKKPDDYWKGLHLSVEREIALTKEACANEQISTPLLQIAEYNRHIHANHAFHFFTKEDLIEAVQHAGFTVKQLTAVYAEQCFMIVLEKPACIHKEA